MYQSRRQSEEVRRRSDAPARHGGAEMTFWGLGILAVGTMVERGGVFRFFLRLAMAAMPTTAIRCVMAGRDPSTSGTAEAKSSHGECHMTTPFTIHVHAGFMHAYCIG